MTRERRTRRCGAQGETTGVFRSCALAQKRGLSAPSVPAESPRYLQRRMVVVGQRGALIRQAQVLYEAADPTARQLQLGAVLIGFGLTMTLLCRGV